MASTSQDEKVFASPARPPSYKKIPNCDNSEDHSRENQNPNIPFDVQAHFDNVRQLYLKFMNEMGVSSYFKHMTSKFFTLKITNFRRGFLLQCYTAPLKYGRFLQSFFEHF